MIEAAVAKATAPLFERIGALEAELAEAKKNSSNSSKPPSSDLVKPPKPPRPDGRKRQRGGQPGHEQHLREEFPPEAIDQVVYHVLHTRRPPVNEEFPPGCIPVCARAVFC